MSGHAAVVSRASSSLDARILRSSGWVAVSWGGRHLLSLLTMLVLARLVEPRVRARRCGSDDRDRDRRLPGVGDGCGAHLSERGCPARRGHRLRLLVDERAWLKVGVRNARTDRLVRLLRRSRVGDTVSGKEHVWNYHQGEGRVQIVLRLRRASVANRSLELVLIATSEAASRRSSFRSRDAGERGGCNAVTATDKRRLSRPRRCARLEDVSPTGARPRRPSGTIAPAGPGWVK